ncbi:MAG: transcription-repair coupling factor [Deltaproteobacteria bacterium]|nr:transcription-repair coupling factor [Deltaproteobacteria bacterium]
MTLHELLAQQAMLPSGTQFVGLEGSAPAYVLCRLAIASEHLWCCIVPTPQAAEAFTADCRFFLPEEWRERVAVFPASDARPYQSMAISPDVQAARLATLLQLCQGASRIVIAPITALLTPTLLPAALRNHTHEYTTGALQDRDRVVARCGEAGYTTAPLVEDIGTMAVRGAIVDCWPPNAARPIRIEWEGDCIASIRAFDPATQRSQARQDAVTIGPAAELLFTEATRERALAAWRRRADEAGLSAGARRAVTEAIQHGRRPPWVDTLVPLFYEQAATVRDFLPANTTIVWHDLVAIGEEASAHADRIRAAHAKADPALQTIAPAELIACLDTFSRPAKAHRTIVIGPAPTMPTTPPIAFATESTTALRHRLPTAATDQDPLTPLAEYLRQAAQERYRIDIACHTSLAADRTTDLLRWHGLTPVTLHIMVGTLSAGFRWPEERLCILTEEELFGRKIAARPSKRPVSAAAAFLSFQDLEPGDLLVHEHHGIGRFLGLQQLAIKQIINDFVVLEYLGGDKLYLPVYRLHLLQRYVGAGDGAPTLDRLGGTRWAKATTRARASIRVMAQDLLTIYAARKVRAGTQFSGRDHVLEEFEAAFPYDETPDQWQAIEDVLRDMASERPMDRLICGDVGYGKTEVAMRAAFRAVLDGKQVAVLVPTTLLAFQHVQTFTQRFAGTAARIEMLSRFRTRAEQTAVLADTAKGAVDILIGTHRLLQKDVALPRLGLLVIDEEQRFGVAHKEHLRKLKATVDTLTLSATPIPRTLHMALGGLRDISVIQTPPADRQAIRTHVVPFGDDLIRDAMIFELQRGGEVFFVHNRVETIAAMRDHLQHLAPEARIVVAHGQMEEDALEAAMMQFIGKEANVLLCTSIIESGLDIPSANTLLVNRADTFGLAQLYQIRGRVGRSSVQAVAYLLTPAEETVSPLAQKRLAALSRFTELGSGFAIAMHDLEIRGAGNLLGAQQSGHIVEIGYEMFTRLLEQTIRRLQNEPETADIDVEITLPVPAYLPEEYVTDPNTRIVWYKRLSGLEAREDIDDAAAELEDRFGPLPDAARMLLRIIEIKQAARGLGMDQIRYDRGTFLFRFHAQAPVDPAKLLAHVAKHARAQQLRPNGVLAIKQPCADTGEIVRSALRHLEMLCPIRTTN